jgi:hypothetical protein
VLVSSYLQGFLLGPGKVIFCLSPLSHLYGLIGVKKNGESKPCLLLTWLLQMFLKTTTVCQSAPLHRPWSKQFSHVQLHNDQQSTVLGQQNLMRAVVWYEQASFYDAVPCYPWTCRKVCTSGSLFLPSNSQTGWFLICTGWPCLLLSDTTGQRQGYSYCQGTVPA